MQKTNTLALLISTYNWPQALELVFLSILEQTLIPDEIVIADDGSDERTKKLIDKYQHLFKTKVKHIWHEDKGFRKTIILNKAVAAIESNYIVQIDGDIILHNKFIKDHFNAAKENYFVKGSRAMLTDEKTKELLNNKKVNISSYQSGIKSSINGTRIKLLSLLFKGKPNESRNTKGCNFAFWKKDFITVNGYNNDLLGWGHEDIEIAARFVNSGIKRQQLKMIAVCFHLYHNTSNENLSKTKYSNLEVYNYTIKNNIQTCANGYYETK